VRSSEWVALVYFLYVASAGAAQRRPLAMRARIVLVSLVLAVAVWRSVTAPPIVRDWLPAIEILAGYFVTGWLFVAPSARVEAWLAAWDRRLLGDPVTRFTRWPRAWLAYLEIVYVGCFLLVPAGLAVLFVNGRADLVNRYWTMVAAAEFGAFAPLAIIQTRPPWAIERPSRLPDQSVHRFASYFTQQFTIRVNTFPSGHVAGSLAVALAVLTALPAAGAVFLILAISIAIATVAGRYHYVVDVVAGALLAASIWVAATLSGV
jgi:membrane-associated phospholipid phosphatase